MKQIFKRNFFAALSLLFISLTGKTQQVYTANQTDLIFSLAQMNASTISTSPVLRFSGFINHEAQMHIDFGKTTGMYTALGIKNIGLINHIENRGMNVKQRAYALSIPLAFKLGNMKRQAYVALGGEINLMTHYKQKFLYGDAKTKEGEWFSNKVNLLNPAVFFQVKYLKSQVITFKYFLNDFLRYQPAGLMLPDGTVIPDYGQSSKLFYISWGTSIANKNPSEKKQEQELEKMKSARWVE